MSSSAKPRPLCSACAVLSRRWEDFQHGERYRKWIDYKPTLNTRHRWAVDAYRRRAEDRRELIRAQLDAIAATCQTHHQGVAA